MKKLASLIATGVLLLSTATVFAGKPADTPNNGKSHEKATGSIEYYQEGYHFEFNAHEGAWGEAKGKAHNMTSGGDYYNADVRCAVVHGDDAWFAAELITQSVPSWGPYVLIKVHDGSTPGTETDKMWGQFVSEAFAQSWCDEPTDPAGGPWDVLGGNLVVHAAPVCEYSVVTTGDSSDGEYGSTVTPVTITNEDCSETSAIRVDAPTFYYGPGGWGGWSCIETGYPDAIGGGFIPETSTPLAYGIAEPGSTVGGYTYPTWPHYPFPSGEEGYVVQGAGLGNPSNIFVLCAE